jgi:hypothetical protein
MVCLNIGINETIEATQGLGCNRAIAETFDVTQNCEALLNNF